MKQSMTKQAVALVAALGAALAAQAQSTTPSTAESRPQSQMQQSPPTDNSRNADPGYRTPPSSTSDNSGSSRNDRFDNAPPTSAGAASDAASEPAHGKKSHKHKGKRHGHGASDAASLPNRASHSGGSASASAATH